MCTLSEAYKEKNYAKKTDLTECLLILLHQKIQYTISTNPEIIISIPTNLIMVAKIPDAPTKFGIFNNKNQPIINFTINPAIIIYYFYKTSIFIPITSSQLFSFVFFIHRSNNLYLHQKSISFFHPLQNTVPPDKLLSNLNSTMYQKHL